ncbi:MAG: citramalate synthase [Magnetococcales bacterium]|nr:citramalate synthase [Magnetococcales bacterium]
MPIEAGGHPAPDQAADARLFLYDTTLRDGAQSEDVLFSLEDKLRILERLDALGIDYVEGGWPGAIPKDGLFFKEAMRQPLRHARLVVFGSTAKPGVPVAADGVLADLLAAGTGAVCIFGKSWDLHVQRALGISLEANLALIHDSVRYLKSRSDIVFFDAEHFFDGYKANPEYALKSLGAARDAGAEALILCDTNGGTLVDEVARMTRAALALGAPLGIHCHNDSGLAVANSLAAVVAGAVQVQGTVNGLGERCGNTDLLSVIPNLMLKMGRRTGLERERLRELTPLSRFVNELANRPPQRNQPFVGSSAFTHKAGVHASAVLKDPVTYEHLSPELLGNRRRIPVSEQSGRSNLVAKFQEFGIDDVRASDPRVGELLAEVKELELKGYQFDGAEASFELRARRALGQVPDYFELRGFRVIDERRLWSDQSRVPGAEATVKVRVAGQTEHLVAEGQGPVDALMKALTKALGRYYPGIDEIALTDFKVRILDGKGTQAVVRVLIEWRDRQRSWGTVGVSDHIIAASYDAMVDAVVFKLFSDGVAPAIVPANAFAAGAPVGSV